LQCFQAQEQKQQNEATRHAEQLKLAQDAHAADMMKVSELIAFLMQAAV
jgi:hypothetical protein